MACSSNNCGENVIEYLAKKAKLNKNNINLAGDIKIDDSMRRSFLFNPTRKKQSESYMKKVTNLDRTKTYTYRNSMNRKHKFYGKIEHDYKLESKASVELMDAVYKVRRHIIHPENYQSIIDHCKKTGCEDLTIELIVDPLTKKFFYHRLVINGPSSVVKGNYGESCKGVRERLGP